MRLKRKLLNAIVLASMLIAPVGAGHATLRRPSKPKILLLYDMEGVSGINRLVQVFYPNPEYKAARHLLTADVNAAIRGLIAGGAGEIVVIDGHGSGNSNEPDIIVEEMDKRASMGFRDTKFDPYTSPDATYQAIVSIGAHASTGKPGFLAHTRSRISAYKVNGVELTETTIIALAGMRFRVPVIMVSGDDVLEGQIKEQFPNAEYALVKKARGVGDAELLPLEVAHDNIERAAKLAISKLPSFKPLQIKKPYNFEMIFRNGDQADYASDYPGVKRIGASTVAFTTNDVIEGINKGETLARIARQEFRDVLFDVVQAQPNGKEIIAEWRRQLDERWLNPKPETSLPAQTRSPAQKRRYWGDN